MRPAGSLEELERRRDWNSLDGRVAAGSDTTVWLNRSWYGIETFRRSTAPSSLYIQKDSDPATRIPCKVVSWQMNPDRSSQAVILLPATVPPDIYDVVIATKLAEGVAEDVLTVVP